jgi:hypothetical protein
LTEWVSKSRNDRLADEATVRRGAADYDTGLTRAGVRDVGESLQDLDRKIRNLERIAEKWRENGARFDSKG